MVIYNNKQKFQCIDFSVTQDTDFKWEDYECRRKLNSEII